jgi:hypothetical protein
MRKLAFMLIGLLGLAACRPQTSKPGYIVQVSLGSWNKADYSVEQVISRIDTVSALTPRRKVIIGWSQDKSYLSNPGCSPACKRYQDAAMAPGFR